jgi:hypothetical protein
VFNDAFHFDGGSQPSAAELEMLRKIRFEPTPPDTLVMGIFFRIRGQPIRSGLPAIRIE